MVLVSGTSLYNELIRSCLPTMYESTVDSDAEVKFLAGIDTMQVLFCMGDSLQTSLCGITVKALPLTLLLSRGLWAPGCPAGQTPGTRTPDADQQSCPLAHVAARSGDVGRVLSLLNSLQDALLPAAPEGSGRAAGPHEAYDGLRLSPGRSMRVMAKPRSISGSLYTMARSMRLFPTALSPHR